MAQLTASSVWMDQDVGKALHINASMTLSHCQYSPYLSPKRSFEFSSEGGNVNIVFDASCRLVNKVANPDLGTRWLYGNEQSDLAIALPNAWLHSYGALHIDTVIADYRFEGVSLNEAFGLSKYCREHSWVHEPSFEARSI